MAGHEGRQRRIAGGRPVVRKVKLTSEDDRRLAELAAREGVTVPRLMVETALRRGGYSPAARRAVFAQLFGLRTDLARIGNNLNQLTRSTHTEGRLPVGLEQLMARLGELADTAERTVQELRS